MKTMIKINYKIRHIYSSSHFPAYLFSFSVYETFSIARAVFLRSFYSFSFIFPLYYQNIICIKKTIAPLPLLCLQYEVRQNKLISMFVLNGFTTISEFSLEIR